MCIEKIEITSEEFMKKKKIFKKIFSIRRFDDKVIKTNWKLVRKIGNFAYQFKSKENDIEFKFDMIDDVNVLVASPKEKNDKAILYIHGGGFVSGGIKGSKSFCSMLASYTNSVVYACEYSLAPEKPFPYGFNDCVNVYKKLVNLYSSVTLIGDSAGGNLVLAVALKAKEDKIKMPNLVVAHSPVVDLSMTIKRGNDEKDFIVKNSCFPQLKEIYCGDSDPKRYEISPYFGDYNNYSKLYITCDEDETMFNDAKLLYDKAIAASVDAKLVIFKNGFHACATIGTKSPETNKVLEEIANILKDI